MVEELFPVEQSETDVPTLSRRETLRGEIDRMISLRRGNGWGGDWRGIRCVHVVQLQMRLFTERTTG
jgi:hypothetical protein